jgi:hypothetical protein
MSAKKPKAAPKKSAAGKSAPAKAVERKPLRRTIRGGRPMFFDDTAIDKVFNMVVTLAGEVWILRERLAAMEAVQVSSGSLKKGQIDAHEFDAADEATLAGQRKEFIDNLFRILEEQVEQARQRGRKA